MIAQYKDLLGYLSVLASLIATVRYVSLVLKGKIKPHVFTWVIWALVMGIAAAARSAENAGPGAWGQWAACIACLIVAALALRRGNKTITLSDWIVFIAALAAIPVWRATKDPLFAIVMVSLIDALGYYPTIRKSWLRPREEAIFNYAVGNITTVLSLLATATYNFATVLYPAVLLICNTVLITLILWRRHKIIPGRLKFTH